MIHLNTSHISYLVNPKVSKVLIDRIIMIISPTDIFINRDFIIIDEYQLLVRTDFWVFIDTNSEENH